MREYNIERRSCLYKLMLDMLVNKISYFLLENKSSINNLQEPKLVCLCDYKMWTFAATLGI